MLGALALLGVTLLLLGASLLLLDEGARKHLGHTDGSTDESNVDGESSDPPWPGAERE